MSRPSPYFAATDERGEEGEPSACGGCFIIIVLLFIAAFVIRAIQ